jgi:hypothetical protein
MLSVLSKTTTHERATTLKILESNPAIVNLKKLLRQRNSEKATLAVKKKGKGGGDDLILPYYTPTGPQD